MLCNEVDALKGGHSEDNGQNGDIVEESEETLLNITVSFYFQKVYSVIFRSVTVMLML